MDKITYSSIRRKLNFEPSGLALVKHVVQDIFILASVAWLLSVNATPAYLGGQLLLACLYFRAFSLMHDAVHGSLSRHRLVNNVFGIFYGGVCFLPFSTWKLVHLDHHAWAGNVDRDPVMRIVREFPKKSGYRKKLDTILWRSWVPYLAFMQQVLFWSVSAKKMISTKHSNVSELLASVVAPLALFIGLFSVGQLFGNALYFLPSLLIYLVMIEIVNFPHHLNLPRVQGENKLSLREQYKISRTCIYSVWFSRLVLLNFNYHAEHHMFPALPWHQLPKAHDAIRATVPSGYQMADGHQWILVNRRKNLEEVFAPTEIFTPSENIESKAA